jgi:DNA-binding NtrC family response regulator
MSDATPTVVAVINSTSDVVDMLRIVLQDAGFVVVTAFTHDIRDGRVELDQFMAHRPSVVVYDVAPPYQANWKLFQHIRRLEAMQDCAFVLTSTNVARVRKMIQTGEPFYEIVDTPYDLDQLVDAVRNAVGRRVRGSGYG